jgi:hypothetical protein
VQRAQGQVRRNPDERAVGLNTALFERDRRVGVARAT